MKNEKIYFWPKWFYDSLNDCELQIENLTVEKLSRANIYLWRALNIYDDFLDGVGQPEDLPLANAYYRKFLSTYYSLNLKNNFYKTFELILTDLDRANREEVLNWRLKIKKNKLLLPYDLPSSLEELNPLKLSRKSLALSLGPIAMISQSSAKNTEQKINLTTNLFRCLLATKQLADDARDWWDDLKNGHITIANLPILNYAKKQKLKLDFQNKPEFVHLLFATEASPIICEQLKELIKKAQKISQSLNLKPNNQLMKEILGPIKIGLQETERFRHQLLKTNQTML